MYKIGETTGICSICEEKVKADIYQRNGKVIIETKCVQHGKKISEHIWDDPEIYKNFIRCKTLKAEPAQTAVILTYKCNLNCPICLADANKLKFDDFKKKNLSKIHEGQTVLLTGGEPTVRKDLPKIISHLKKEKKRVVLLSNGVKLANMSYTLKLKRAGLNGVRLQFDATDDKDNLYIRGKKLFEIKKRAVKNLERLEIPVILCSVIIKKNIKSVQKLFNFAFKHSNIRSVSVNPLWKLGRYKENDFVASSDIIKKVSRIFNLRKKDWIDSTIFLTNLDKLLSFFFQRKRYFCKCNIKFIFIRDRKTVIPITRIFDIQKINNKIESAYSKQSRIEVALFFLYFIISQIIFNFLKNRHFRLLVLKVTLNLKNIFKKNFFFRYIFYSISVESFMTKENFDFNVSQDCNLNGLSPENSSLKPACLNRLNLTK